MLVGVSRFSAAVRRCTNTSDGDRDPLPLDSCDLAFALVDQPRLEQLLVEREQYEQATHTSSALLYWRHLMTAVEVTGCRRQLKQLRRVVLQLLGGEVPPQLLDECTGLAVQQLVGCKQLSETLRVRLATTLIGLTRSQGDLLLQAVRDLTEGMGAEVRQQLVTVADGMSAGDGNVHSAPSSSISADAFGSTLKLGALDDYVCEFGHVRFIDTLCERAANENSSNVFGAPKPSAKIPTARSVDFDVAWLRTQLARVVDTAETLDSMMESVRGLLRSEQSNDLLQNELLELLGFDSIELITSLLENRGALVANFAVTQLKTTSHDIRQQIIKNNTQTGCTGVIACNSVVVHTEREVQAQKAVRREEKRLARLRASASTAVSSATPAIDTSHLISRSHSVLAAKTKSEAELLLAKRSPIFGPSAARSTEASSAPLPHVYDGSVSVRLTSAFITGCRVSLPEDCQWTNNEQYQAVEIPPSQPAPPSVGEHRVPIAALDTIGQNGFVGVKSLNRIQSVVFETAYYSNENLLICAPTGAGKTNIAMLTMLHQIREHVVDDVIQLDQFKIVYVSPMKALAAEMTANFGRRLQSLGVTVRECTGDMQLSKQQILSTHVLVTTPEKWDVLSRKSDITLTQMLKLLIIDEVHLLHGDRGPVVEALVARTIRQVESSQSMIRIVGLSATLPNYLDVAQFLRVNPWKGLFFFDGRFRPVPLGQRFVGVHGVGYMQQMNHMDTVCYDEAFDMVNKGHQVMVFVHARNATSRTALALREIAKVRGQLSVFRGEPSAGAVKSMSRARNGQLTELFADGFSVHHAGLLRQDRSLVERLFSDGEIKVLCCTSTLAWGVNLPAHAVIIRGTDIYDASRGSFVDLGVLDVMQIFGRAGRPQYDSSGHGTIITTHAKLAHYLALLTNQYPIESSFVSLLADNLNAEVCLGTVSTVEEAVQWLTYTYLYVRMRKNPLVYGIKPEELQEDPQLTQKCHALIDDAAAKLDKALMMRYDISNGYLSITDQGRTASHFYVKYDTIEVVNEMLNPFMNYRDILAMLSRSSEFEQIKVRDEELEELDRHIDEDCEEAVLGGSENVHGKVNILLQTYISRGFVHSFSLTSDMNYVVQNATRICRALFELCLDKKWPLMAGRVLTCCQQLERRQWHSESPLRQCAGRHLDRDLLDKLEQRQLLPAVIREMDLKELGVVVRNMRRAEDVQRAAFEVPSLILEASVQPITRRVLRVRVTLTPDFRWSDRVHGKYSENFLLWVEDTENNFIYHTERFVINKKHVLQSQPQSLMFTVPVFEPLPTQYLVRVVNDRWLGTETVFSLSFRDLILPERHPPQTDLLPLEPLPVTALQNSEYQSLYSFSHFNAVQTQIFHTLYHTDGNVLLGAPTGSGKTIAAELAILRVFNHYPTSKVVYIAPMKALVRERITDWSGRLGRGLGRSVVELTGDVTPDLSVVQSADVIVTTPEKWDGISRSWQTRHYVQHVSLLIIDEIHLLGEDRGPVLEVIVSRVNYISSHTRHAVRVLGLSTAMANANDLADWLGIKESGLFNFRPSVRPVPLEVHIQGFPGKHYCPRMATMNKPTFKAIRTHSPSKPALVFVSSRRQTRITAFDLISCLAAEEDPKQWLHMPEQQLDELTKDVHDQNLRLSLAFGIGIHHAGLVEFDRKLVEGLFVEQKIQILVATATVAWGVNFPAHLVVVKGTEYYDAKQKRYVDFPVTDVLQMMGRAGRPQFDDQGVAVVMVHDVKKHFYKQFLYEPFPVESSLLQVLPDHLNAEIVSGSVSSRQDAMDYLTWTFLFRRVLQNPSYYGLSSTESEAVNTFLSMVVDRAVALLQDSGCVHVEEDGRGLAPTVAGRIGAYYYISHKTMRRFDSQLTARSALTDVLHVLSQSAEYEEVPVRHNEELVNSELAKACPLPVGSSALDSPHTKTLLLLQAHFSRLPLPVADYLTDLRSVLDQAVRLLHALLDNVAEHGWLDTALGSILLVQQVYQARWYTDSAMLCLPHVELCCANRLDDTYSCLAAAALDARRGSTRLLDILSRYMDGWKVDEAVGYLRQIPLVSVQMLLQPCISADQQSTCPRRVNLKSRDRIKQCDWLSVSADTMCTLSVHLHIDSGDQTGGACLTPRYHKRKSVSWLVVLAEVETAQLWALRRLAPEGDSCARRSASVSRVRKRERKCRLVFQSPSTPGRRVLTVYVLSDCLLGLDQQYDVCVDVV